MQNELSIGVVFMFPLSFLLLSLSLRSSVAAHQQAIEAEKQKRVELQRQQVWLVSKLRILSTLPARMLDVAHCCCLLLSSRCIGAAGAVGPKCGQPAAGAA